MSVAEGVKLVLHTLAVHDTEQHRTGGCITSVSPLLPDGFVVRAGDQKLVRVVVKDVPTGDKLHPGATVLAEMLRTLLQENKLGFVPSKIDFSSKNVLMEVAFNVLGGDGTLYDRPTLYRVTVEKIATRGEPAFPTEVCPHGVKIEHDTAKSAFASYCRCCRAWLGTRVSDRCTKCEVEPCGGGLVRKLYQVKMITNTMSSEHYHPLFIVRADNENEVYARLPLMGLTENIRHNWEVSEVLGEKVSLAKMLKKAIRAVKRKGYPIAKKGWQNRTG